MCPNHPAVVLTYLMYMLGDQTPFGDGGGRGRRRERVTVQYIPDRDSRVVNEVGFRIPRVGFRIPGTGFRIPKPWIPDSRNKKTLDSGFRVPLHGAIYQLPCRQRPRLEHRQPNRLLVRHQP